LILLYVLLVLVFIRIPSIAADTTHDRGSRMSFEYYAHARYQFGVDVIQNIGPYGYLQFPRDYSGILPAQKFLFGIVFALILAWLALSARLYFSSLPAKIIWFLAIILAPIPAGEDLDQLIYLFILLSANHLLLADRSKPAGFILDAIICVFLALLCLMKSTNTMLIGLLMVLVVFQRMRGRQYLHLACNLGIFWIATLVLWVLAGQKLPNFPQFMRGAMLFSSGYNEAMALVVADESQLVSLALAMIGLFVAVNVFRFRHFRKYFFRLPLTVFEAACLFIVWKHGFVRADHAIYFWYFAMSAGPLLFLAHEGLLAGKHIPTTSQPGSGWTSLFRRAFNTSRLPALLLAVELICVVGACRIEKDDQAGQPRYFTGIGTAFAVSFSHIRSNFYGLIDWRGRSRTLASTLQNNRAAVAVPSVQKTVGTATVDEFGCLPGVPLLNDLHYTPRPMPISFMACNELLMLRNAEFYRNDSTAPAFLLSCICGPDPRFIPQDDALAMLEVLGHYRLILVDKGIPLLKRANGQPGLGRELQDTRTITWGESILLPSAGGKGIWCTVEIRPSLIGRMRSFFYKPAQIFIVLESHGQIIGTMRFLATAGPVGFLANPFIMNNADLAGAYGIQVEPASGRTPQFDGFSFVTALNEWHCFQPAIKVSFWTIEKQK
jgi:hypothetical protein